MTEQQYNRLKPFKHIWILYKKTYTANLEGCADTIMEIAEQLTGLKFKGGCSGCLPECLQKCFMAFDKHEAQFVTDEFSKSDVPEFIEEVEIGKDENNFGTIKTKIAVKTKHGKTKGNKEH